MKVDIIVRGSEYDGTVSPDIVTTRTLLFLYFKKAELRAIPVTSKNKTKVVPDNISLSKLPICFDISTNTYMTDILDIESYYDKEYTDTSLKCSEELVELAHDIYKQFLFYIKKPSDEYMKKISYCLVDIENQIRKSGGEFINGKNPSLADCIIYPKIYHLERYLALSNGHNVFETDTYPRVAEYYRMMHSLPNTDCMKHDSSTLINFFVSKGADRSLFKKK